MGKTRRHGDGWMYTLQGPSIPQTVIAHILQMKLEIQSPCQDLVAQW